MQFYTPYQNKEVCVFPAKGKMQVRYAGIRFIFRVQLPRNQYDL